MALGATFRKWWKKIYTKMVSEKATPEYIARGWAIGMFYGCFIPFGVQLAMSIPTAFALKGSKIGATLGTLITNHFTIFIIYPIQCYVGNKIIGGDLGYSEVVQAMSDLIKNQDFSTLVKMSWELIISFFVGGALLTAIMTPLTYIFVKKLVTARQARKKRRQEAKLNSSN
jgi:uncharacterized protein (DUF2062 family)